MSSQDGVENNRTSYNQEDSNSMLSVPSNQEEYANNNVPTLPQGVIDRLNSHIQQKRSGIKPEPGKNYLEQIGHLIRPWRLKKGYVRAELAKKLKLDEDLLLCIERRIALPEDITEEQLLMLQSLLGTNDLDRQLEASIQNYLTTPKI